MLNEKEIKTTTTKVVHNDVWIRECGIYRERER